MFSPHIDFFLYYNRLFQYKSSIVIIYVNIYFDMIKKYTFLGIYEKVMSYQALNLVIQIRLLGDFFPKTL